MKSFARLLIPAVCLCAVLPALPAHATPVQAFSFSAATFRTDDPNTAELGYDFTTGSSALYVNSLGYINDGFNGTHTVEIFNVATQQAVSGALATVTTIGGGATSNTFTFTNLGSPVLLAANTEYQIVSQFFTNEHYFTVATGFNSNPDLNFNIAVYDDYGNPPATPAFANGSAAGNNPGDFGPNLQVSAPTPEPSSLLLLGTGLLAVGCACRLRTA